ncbi:MAG: AMP-binding protein, partial [Nitrospirae bacterium]|nr:AMP-binding protein [Nitrospirota bacterium]
MPEAVNIDVLMDEHRLFPPTEEFSKKAHIKSMDEYTKIYQRSITDPEGFWAEMAEKNLHWYKKWDKILDYDFNKPYVKWFEGGKLNASYNCLDRFINTPARNKAAIIWESNDGADHRTYTYQQLYYEVNRFANVLKKHGIKKGDRVTIYLPMLPETVIALLACARVGAIHSVVFGGFSAQALKERIQDCGSKLVITADYGARGNKFIPLKASADEAVAHCPSVQTMIVVKDRKATLGGIVNVPGRDFWWHDEINAPDI